MSVPEGSPQVNKFEQVLATRCIKQGWGRCQRVPVQRGKGPRLGQAPNWGSLYGEVQGFMDNLHKRPSHNGGCGNNLSDVIHGT